MSDRPPSKPWRVKWLGANSADYRGKSAAYEAVRSITERRLKATVYHWENGDWRLYERVEPAG